MATEYFAKQQRKGFFRTMSRKQQPDVSTAGKDEADDRMWWEYYGADRVTCCVNIHIFLFNGNTPIAMQAEDPQSFACRCNGNAATVHVF